MDREKVVFTFGTFDLIHSGHAAYLLKAKSYGDKLIVGIASNRSQKKVRGVGFPLIDQKNRAELIKYFDFVDEVIICNKQNLLPTLRKIKPDVFFTLAVDWRSHLRKSKEEKYVENYGGKVMKIPQSDPYVSTSMVVERVADLKIKEIIEYFFGKTKIDLSKRNWKRTKWSGLKTNIRAEALDFLNHAKDIDLFAVKYFGEIVSVKNLKKLGEKLRREGKKIVLTAGACDLLHAGHARFYAKGKSFGDVMVLGIPSDKVISRQKGRGRPIVTENSRAELMAFFGFIDYIFIFDDEDIFPAMKTLKPDVFFTVKEEWNETAGKNQIDFMKEWNGKVEAVPPQSPKLSSSRLIRKAAGIRVKEVFKEVLKEAERSGSIKD